MLLPADLRDDARRRPRGARRQRPGAGRSGRRDRTVWADRLDRASRQRASDWPCVDILDLTDVAAIARRRPQLDLAFIESEFWSDIDRSATLCTYFSGRLESLFPVRSGTFTLWLRTLIICRLALVAHVDSLLRDHRAAGQMAIGDSPGTEPAYLGEVDRLLKQSRERVFRCMVHRPEPDRLTSSAKR